MQGAPTSIILKEASPARLAISKVGLMDTIFFQQEYSSSLPREGFVDVDVKAVSLNAKARYSYSIRAQANAGCRISMYFREKLRPGMALLQLNLAASSRQSDHLSRSWKLAIESSFWLLIHSEPPKRFPLGRVRRSCQKKNSR